MHFSYKTNIFKLDKYCQIKEHCSQKGVIQDFQSAPDIGTKHFLKMLDALRQQVL